MELVSWEYSDIRSLSDLYADTDQRFCLVQIPVPLPPEATKRYVNAIRSQIVDGKPFICFAIKEDETIIGKVELTKHDEITAEIDIVIRRKYTHQGIGTAVINALCEALITSGWCSVIEAFVSAENIPAIGLFRRTGFQESRCFQADVLMPNENVYQLKTVSGIEFIKHLANSSAII